VNGEPGDIRVGHLDLTGVQSRTDTEAHLADSISDCAGTGDGAGGTVEGGEEPVAHRLDLSSSKTFELSTDHLTLMLEQRAPALICS